MGQWDINLTKKQKTTEDLNESSLQRENTGPRVML